MWVGEGYYSRFNFFMGASGCKGSPTITGFMLAIFLTVACQHGKNSKSRPGSEGGLIRGFARKGCAIRLPIFQKLYRPPIQSKTQALSRLLRAVPRLLEVLSYAVTSGAAVAACKVAA